jgi:hypothetical protein
VTLAVVVLTALLAAVCWAVFARSRPAAWAVVVLSAVWLPANNGHLEGRTLLVLSDTHGVTQADALGLSCWLIASLVLMRRATVAASARPRWVRSAVPLLTSGMVFAAGALAALGSS